MKNLFAYLRAIGLGAMNGFIFGSICEIVYQIRFRFVLRELDRIAAEGGPNIDVWYPWHLWTLPGFFMLVFAIVSLFMHWLRSKRALSRTRLWQEIGLLSVVVSLLPIYYYWSSVFSIGAVLFLFGLAFVLNSIFGGFLEMVSNNQARRKRPFLHKGAG